MNRFYSVLITSKYTVMACSVSLEDAAATIKAMRTPSRILIVRDGQTGKRYSYAELHKAA